MISIKELYSRLKEKKYLVIGIKSAFGLFLFGIFSIILLYFLVYFEVFGKLHTTKELSAISNEEASLVYSSDKILIGKFFAENRTNIKRDDIPDHLINALTATEDKRFYSHKGIDTKSYFRVLFKSILLRKNNSGGGSTITQQLVKNLYGREYSGFLKLPVNKMKELIVAKRLEKVYSKDEVLLLYFNSVPFGEDIFGVESAANRYFNKTAKDLKIEESAVLVGMLKANSYYNPHLNPDNALKRRNLVLRLMHSEKHLSKKATDSLQNLPLELNYENLKIKAPAGYFVYQVKKKTIEVLNSVKKKTGKAYNLETDGLKIYTTLNSEIQNIANKSVKSQLTIKQKQLDKEYRLKTIKKRWYKEQEKQSKSLEKDQKIRPVNLFIPDGNLTKNINKFDSLWHYYKMLNASVLVTNPKNGAVITWVGGNDFRTLPFDMVLSHRQIASTFKPILYATALEYGISPCTYLKNEQIIHTEFDDWEPQNADNSSTKDSTVALWYSLINSMNIPTVDLYFKIGRESLIKSCQKLNLPEIQNEAPSIALGTLDISLFEIIRAYGSFANSGKMNELYMIEKITDKDNNTIYLKETKEAVRVFEEETSQMITAILQQAIARGTGAKIRSRYKIKSALAGKTGTAQDYTDAWFVSYTPNIVLGTWVGASTPNVHFSSGNGSGSSLALPIIADILKKIEKDKQLKKQFLVPFDIPEDIYASIQCEPYKQKGVKGFLNRIFRKLEERSDTI